MSSQQAIQLAEEPQEAVSCPLCGNDSHQLIRYGRDRLFARPGMYRIVSCSSCGLRYVSPRPTFEGLALHYPTQYFIYQTPDQLPAFARPLLNAYSAMRFRPSIRRLERVRGRYQPDTKIVDVGCGLNDHLATLRRLRGCVGIGVDFKPEAAAYVRERLKMPVREGTLHDARFAAGELDVVSMIEYLEHEPHPREVLSEARRITKKGGHLVVEIPHTESIAAKIFGSCWSQIDAPRHLVHFTRGTLEEMLRRSGYRLIHTETFQIPFLIGASVLHALGHKHLGRMNLLDRTLMTLAGLPFLLVYPLMDELLFAVARAE
jgi:SAM-dependent methyltransferase